MATHLSLAKDEQRILCYGDSLTAGFTIVSPYTQEYTPWAPVLEQGERCAVRGERVSVMGGTNG